MKVQGVPKNRRLGERCWEFLGRIKCPSINRKCEKFVESLLSFTFIESDTCFFLNGAYIYAVMKSVSLMFSGTPCYFSDKHYKKKLLCIMSIRFVSTFKFGGLKTEPGEKLNSEVLKK